MSGAALRRTAWPVGAALVSLVLTVQPFRDSDVWWHLAMGHYILAHGIPATEPFSFLHAANPWVGQQWLYEVGLARAVDLGGPALASLLMGVVASSALLIAVLSVPPERRPSGPWLAAGLLAGALVAAQLVGVRGQVVSLFFAAVTLNILVRWQRGSVRVLLLLPPLFALWANLHAGFIIGLGIAVLALLTTRGVSTRSRVLLAVAVGGSGLATLLNPAGPGLWSYVGATFTNPTVAGVVTEWQSPDFHGVWVRLFEAAAALLVVAWVVAPPRDLFDLALAGTAFAASLQAQRNISLFALVAAPQLAAYGAAAFDAHRPSLALVSAMSRWRRPPRWFGAGAVMVLAAASALAIAPQLTASAASSYEATHEPMAAVDYAAVHLAGHRLYSIDTWGGYLADRLPTGRVVYLYDETAVFGTAALQRYLDIHDLRPDWAGIIAAAGFSDAILPQAGQEVSALRVLGWTVDCHDPVSGSVVMSASGGRSPAQTPADVAAAIAAAPTCG